MKIDLKLWDGFEFHFEKPPMPQERFGLICGIVFAIIAAHAIIEFFSLLV